MPAAIPNSTFVALLSAAIEVNLGVATCRSIQKLEKF
jgi:hypothetical protein